MFERTSHAVLWNSDAASPLILASELGRRPLGPVVLGKISYASTLGFDLLTRGLPWHVAVWEAGPYAVALLGLSLMVWSVRRVGGPWAAAATAAVGVAVAPDVFYTQIAQAFHGTTWFTVALLNAFLVWLASGSPRPARVVVATAFVGLVAGIDLVSDPLLLPAGVVPFAVAPLLLRSVPSVPRRRIRIVTAATVALSLCVAATGWLTLSAAGLSTAALNTNGPVGVAGWGAMAHHLRMLVSDTTALVAGPSRCTRFGRCR